MPHGKGPPPRPRYVEDYKSLVSWAYRRPARLCHPPAIVRHLGYWIRDIGSFERREELFDKFSNSIQTCNNNFEHETPLATLIGSPSLHRRYQACRLKSDDWQTLPVRMTLELHHEYLTVSTIIELQQLDETLPASTPVTGRLVSAIARLRKVTTERHEELSSKSLPRGKPERMTDVRQKLESPYQDIFIKVWDDFYEQILLNPVGDMGSDLGEVFADFRGFIASCTDLGGPFFGKDAPPPARTKSPRVFSEDDSIQRAHVMLPFMTAEPETIKGKEEKELTISRFLDGRCIYASTLGAQPPESEQKAEQPITYFILTNAVNSWQTGRLVDRIHTLGTLRLAARRYLGLLNKAGDDLHELEKEILETVDPRIPSMIMSDFATNEVMRVLSDASSRLRGIRQSIPGGLPYRVERSRYYRSQFKTLLTALRLGPGGRIEGFQPYDEFVERRFGSAYEFIDMAGKRFDRVEHQLSVFYQRVRTAEAASLQRQITRQTRTIEVLQEVAESGFFVVLFPYYLGAMLARLFLPLLPLLPFLSHLLPQDPKPIIDSGFTLISGLIGLIMLMVLKRRRRERKSKQRDRAERAKHFTQLNLAEARWAEEPGGEAVDDH
jgi:hypothetical protein